MISKWLPDFITRHVLFALIIGSIVGMGFVLFLIEFDHFTSSEEFCTTCHSMEIVAEPYRQSVHYNPSSGVRASCGDCHVSEGVLSATWDHFLGTKDLIKQLFGPNYDDPVVNALHLPEAAFAARQWFKNKDSATCKRCHVKEAINGDRANTLKIHQDDAKNKTCIECHYNLVHRKVPDEKVFKRDKWNQMIEKEFSLKAGDAEAILNK
ncbi:MAG: NapC/NirT family cytochrome c [Gammaproteobacteria bacterium]|nr:NapC/NirT family cytochrome c [Gammaproteobacteria bacterium]